MDEIDYEHHKYATHSYEVTTIVEHTTFGLKGGSISLLSKACQLIVLKKGCKQMLPTIPSLRVGSLSNNCRGAREKQKEKTFKGVQSISYAQQDFQRKWDTPFPSGP